MKSLSRIIFLLLVAMPAWADRCLKGDCKYGEGFKRFDNGDTFEGSFYNGRREKGVYKWADGTVFEGSFDGTGSIIRIGTQTTPSGVSYCCNFSHELGWVGAGEINYADGRKYVGNLRNSQPSNGFGTLFGADGEVLSEGVWKDGDIVLSATKIRKAQQSIRELQAGNDANQKIINAIKFALEGDSAKFYSSSVPRKAQSYAFTDCKYIDMRVWLFTDKITDDVVLREYDFNKVNWATLDKYFSEYSMRVECVGQCITDKKHYLTPVETLVNNTIYFAKEENPERSWRAIKDIQDQCAGYSTPY